jgi:predicted TIM-barrel fold metal-dependent hydrolase
MTPLDHIDEMRRHYEERMAFIAIPRWDEMAATAAFQKQWMADLTAFRALGSKLCKFWMAPRIRKALGVTLNHPLVESVVQHAADLGFQFMTHIGDPTLWWQQQYADTSVYGTKDEQFDQLEWLLSSFPDRTVIGAHMGGRVEELHRLEVLMKRYPNYHVDCSATKWIVREVARNPDAVRDFIMRHSERVLFGSDVVVGPQYDYDHYASRYWAHLHMWETEYRGESPIEDPDAPQPPRLAGLALSDPVLELMYGGNARRLEAGW